MRSLRLALVGMLVAGPLAGCGSSGGGDLNLPSSTLAKALRQVQNTATTRAEVQFGRPADTVAADGGQLVRGPYQRALGYGMGNLSAVFRLVPQALGFHPERASYAIMAGDPPNNGTLLSGLALAGAPGKLTALGAKHSGATYRFAPDGRINVPGDKVASALPSLIGFNLVRIDGSDFRFGPSTKAVDETRASGSGVLGYRPMADVASCLGDPLAADIVSKLPRAGGGRVPPSRLPKSTRGLRLVGVGLSGKTGAPAVEQMCVSTDSVAHAEAAEAAIRKAVTTGSSLVQNEPWTKLLTGARVTRSGTTVSLTAHPAGSIGGLLLQALQRGDLPGVSG